MRGTRFRGRENDGERGRRAGYQGDSLDRKAGAHRVCGRRVALQLEKRHRVKVKWLRNADFDPRALADGASATLVMVRGRTAVLEEQKSDRTRHISSSRHG